MPDKNPLLYKEDKNTLQFYDFKLKEPSPPFFDIPFEKDCEIQNIFTCTSNLLPSIFF